MPAQDPRELSPEGFERFVRELLDQEGFKLGVEAEVVDWTRHGRHTGSRRAVCRSHDRRRGRRRPQKDPSQGDGIGTADPKPQPER
jgi:hypothetical protein